MRWGNITMIITIISAIINALLQFSHPNDMGISKTSIFAINYNILRIMSGMGGLAYSN